MPPVIGLDFGTTNSAIAVADEGNEATLASFAAGNATTSLPGTALQPSKRKRKPVPTLSIRILKTTPRDASFSRLNPI
jgi:molecular chaperone DnaK (HSP70)